MDNRQPLRCAVVAAVLLGAISSIVLSDEPLKTLVEHELPISYLTISPNGKWLASTDHYEIRIWSTDSWKATATGSKAPGMYKLAFSPDSKLLASAGREAVVWGVPSLEVSSRLKRFSCTDLAFSGNGKFLVLNGELEDEHYRTISGGIHYWDVSKETFDMDRTISDVYGLDMALSPDGRYAITTPFIGKIPPFPPIRISDTRTGELVFKDQAMDMMGAGRVRFTPGGKYVAGGRVREEGLFFWDAKDFTLKKQIILPRGQSVNQFAFSPDSKYVASPAVESDKKTKESLGVVYIFEVASRRLKRKLPAQQRITALTFSPIGKTLVTGDAEGSIKVWDVSDIVPRTMPP